MTAPRPAGSPARAWTATLAFFGDAAAVALFIGLGRRTHDTSGFAGYLTAVRPFLTALIVVWLALFVWQRYIARGGPDVDRVLRVFPAGLLVWSVTAAGGLALRAAGGGGLSGGFPYVTFGVLGVLLLGWRAAVALLRRRNSR